MKAAVFEKPDVISIKQVPVPVIGDDEALIKVGNSPASAGPTGASTPASTRPTSSPSSRSHGSGVVEEVGRKVVGFKPGDRVTADINMSCGHCFYCKQGQKLLCPEFHQLGIHVDGSYAEYVEAPWTQMHKIPDKLGFLEGAFIEPVSCVIHNVKAMKAELASSVAVIGCGLGILHGALAHLRGCAPVIVIGDNKKRLDIAKKMGADYTINVKEVADVVAEVRKAHSRPRGGLCGGGRRQYRYL